MSKAARVEIIHHVFEPAAPEPECIQCPLRTGDEAPIRCVLGWNVKGEWSPCVAGPNCLGPGVKLLIGEEALEREALAKGLRDNLHSNHHAAWRELKWEDLAQWQQDYWREEADAIRAYLGVE